RCPDRITDVRLHDVGAAIPPRVDDHLGVAEVGQRVERHVLQRVRAGERRRAPQQQGEELVPDRESDEWVDHGFAFMRLSESMKKVPEITIRSPAASPLVTSTSSPLCLPVSTSRGSKEPLPRSTNTVFRSPESTIASAGTTSVGGRSNGNSTSTNMPGLSAS